MTREELKAKGYSDEQIEYLMAELGKERNKLNKDMQDKLNAEKASKAELEKQLNAINESNMTEIEKANKATEDANKRIAELERINAKNEQLKNLSQIGIIGDQAENLFDENGNLNYANLGQIISAREEAAKKAQVDEIASQQGNPGGGSTTNKELTSAETFAQSYSKNFSGTDKKSADIISQYTSNGGNQ